MGGRVCFNIRKGGLIAHVSHICYLVVEFSVESVNFGIL